MGGGNFSLSLNLALCFRLWARSIIRSRSAPYSSVHGLATKGTARSHLLDQSMYLSHALWSILCSLSPLSRC